MDADPTESRQSGSSWRFVALGAAMALAIGGWTVAWFAIRANVAERVDAELRRLSESGLVLDCPGREIAGYPFRIEIRCPTSVAVEDRLSGLRATLAGARTATQIYSPKLTIVELDGPITVRDLGGEIGGGRWRLLRASIRVSEGRLERAILEGDGIEGRATKPNEPVVAFKADRIVLHGRPDAAGSSFDVGARLGAAALTVDGRPVGPNALDMVLDAAAIRLPGPASGSGKPFLAAWADNDGRLDIRSVKASTGGLEIDGRGALALESNGRLTGAIKLVATGLDTVAAGAIGGTKVPTDLAVMASGFLLFGKPHKEGPVAGRSLDFTIDQGRMRLGSTPLGVLPPLFRPTP